MIIEQKYEYRKHLLTFDELKRNSKIPVTCECDKCGKRFVTNKKRIIRNRHTLCQACALKAKNGKSIEVGSRFGRLVVIGEGSKIGYSLCRCDCGTEKEIPNDSLKGGRSKSCGCLQRDKAKIHLDELHKIQIGEEHPNWKGGVCKRRENIMAQKRYKDFRKKVFERDNYTCDLCGKGSNRLNAHHLNSYNLYPEQAFDIDNGITLCQKCHKAYHHKFGFINTKEQYERYKKEKEL